MKSKYLLLLMASALVLGACSGQKTSDGSSSEFASQSSGGSSSSSSGTTSTPPSGNWSASIQEDMLYYSGEVLPYANLFARTSPYSQMDNSDVGQPLIVYYDLSNTNKYTANRVSYKSALENKGWTVSYETDSEGEYIYATKMSSDGLNGYEILYWFGDYGNVLQLCNNFLTNELMSENEWADDILEPMVLTLDESLPFMKFADDYLVSYEDMSFVFVDFYYQSLISQYASVLDEAGYELVEDVYVKTTEHYYIYVDMEYYFGNYIYATFMPITTSSDVFPLQEIRTFLEDDSVTLPAFEVTDDTDYEYYIHGGMFIVEGERTTTFESSYEALLVEDTSDMLVKYDTRVYGAFDESFFVEFDDLVDEDYDVTGFRICVYPNTPFDLVDTFPTDSLQEFFECGAIFPSIMLQTTAGFKATDQSTDEDKIFVVEEYSALESSAWSMHVNEFLHDVTNAWYLVSIFEDDSVAIFEDRTGSIVVSLYDDGSVCTMAFSAGSGEAHLPGIILNHDKFNGLKDDTLQLEYYLQLIEGSVSFSSSNDEVATVSESGLVTIISENLGDECTITASITVDETEYTATCAVKVSDIQKITDTITTESFSFIGQGYVHVSHTSDTTSVVYDGYLTYSSSLIQINDKKGNVGLVAGSGEAICSSITFNFESPTAVGKVVDIYASNSAFESSDMYGSMVKIGSVEYQTANPSVTFEFDDEYKYVGFRAQNGAMYMSSIEFVWAC